MRKSNTTSKARKQDRPAKPGKPWDGFPLFAHDSGRWARKINGRLAYFGHWGRRVNGEIVPVDDVAQSARDALERHNDEYAALKEGRIPRAVRSSEAGGTTVQTLCNAFWRFKREAMLNGELSPRTFLQYEAATDLLVEHFGKHRLVSDITPADFAPLRSKLSSRYGFHRLKGSIVAVRVVFKYAFDQELIDKPVRFGQAFSPPNKKAQRRSRREAGKKLFTADELRLILNALDGQEVTIGDDEKVKLAADPVMRAMVLLGINSGYGNTDCSSLPRSAIDFKTGWLDFPRPKTEVARRCPLWRETADALKAAIAVRPSAGSREWMDHTFLTRFGSPFVRVQEHAEKPDKLVPIDALGQRFAKLLKRLGINGRQSLGFYSLRHSFRTIASGAKDEKAADHIMGHTDGSMAGQYIEEIADDRLRAVTDHVRGWLWPDA